MLNKDIKGLMSVPSNEKKKCWCPRCEEMINPETHCCYERRSK